MGAGKETRQQLQLRKEGLEQAAMMMAAEGLAIPAEMSAELQQVQIELSSAGGAVESPRSWTSWLGKTVDGCLLSERLSSGPFSHLFRAVSEANGEQFAVKVAASEKLLSQNTDDCFCKQAFSCSMEIVRHPDISPNTVIESECKKLRSDDSGCFVKVLSSGYFEECCYYRMPLLEGQSLKELMQLTDMPFLDCGIDILRRLCTMLERIAESNNRYHGNLQPDNIFVTKTDIVLLSPGSFNVDETPLIISTPGYYPFFEPNDLVAAACVFWEVICKRHPLAVSGLSPRQTLFSDDMKDAIAYHFSLVHEPLCQLMKLKLPRELRDDLSAEAETVMMKAFKLAFDRQGLITGDHGFAYFAELEAALKHLSESGLLKKL